MIFDAFKPNKSITGTTLTLIIVVQTVLLLTIWSFGSAFMIPSPIEIGRAWISLVTQQGLLYELGISITTNLEAIFISAVLSIGLAYLTVVPFMRPIVEALSKFRFFSMTGFVIIFTMIFGGNHALKISLLVFGISVFFVTSMTSVVLSIPKEDFDHARSLRMSPWRTVWEVVILGKADDAIEVLRQNAAMGWMMLTLVEGLVRSEGGIGGMLLNESKHFHLDAVFAIQLTVLLIGIAQDRIISWLKTVFCPYSSLTLERK